MPFIYYSMLCISGEWINEHTVYRKRHNKEKGLKVLQWQWRQHRCSHSQLQEILYNLSCCNRCVPCSSKARGRSLLYPSSVSYRQLCCWPVKSVHSTWFRSPTAPLDPHQRSLKWVMDSLHLWSGREESRILVHKNRAGAWRSRRLRLNEGCNHQLFKTLNHGVVRRCCTNIHVHAHAHTRRRTRACRRSAGFSNRVSEDRQTGDG